MLPASLKPGSRRIELPLQRPFAYTATALSQATTLAELIPEYTLFTHATLFTHGRWSRDPVYDYLMENSRARAPMLIELPSKLFYGLEFRNENNRIDSSWCYKLFAIKTEGWVDFYNFMSTAGGIDRLRGDFYRVIAQCFPVPDVLALEKIILLPKTCPTVDVTMFGLDGNKRMVYFKPALNPPLDKPKVAIGEAEAETIELANRIFNNEEQNCLHVDQFEPPGITLGE